MKTQTEQNKSSEKSGQPTSASKTSKSDQSNLTSSQRATAMAKRGEPLEAKNPKERSPKQENL